MLNKKEEIINNKFGVPAARAHFYCPVGRGDPTPPQKPSPLGGRWRACAPDEGETPAPPHQSPSVTASPEGGKPFGRFVHYIVATANHPRQLRCRGWCPFQKIRAIPHNSKCRYGERGAADAKTKAQIILCVLSSILATQMLCRSRRSGA